MPAEILTVHARLGALERQTQGSFGLHIWGSAITEETAWDNPLTACDEDWFGLTFQVRLSRDVPKEASSPALGLLLHKGEDKRIQVELSPSQVPEVGSSIWIGLGEMLTREPDVAEVPVGDLSTNGARGHWLSTQFIAWRAASIAPQGSRFLLHASASACSVDATRATDCGGYVKADTETALGAERGTFSLQDAGASGVSGDGPEGPWELTLAQSDLTPALATAHPYLKGCALLSVPQEVDARDLCRRQLALSMLGPDGKSLDCTGIQLGPLLDDVFGYSGPLGCHPQHGDKTLGVELMLWAPTAISVHVCLFEDALGPMKEMKSMHRRLHTADDGVWRVSGPPSWWGEYYTYRVQCFHPSMGRFLTADTPDPYSHACSADALRTLMCHLPSWYDVVPNQDRTAWLSQLPPPLSCRANAAIYELHVRDFSACDESVSPQLRGKYLAFELLGTNGDVHLRKLASAGITHVQLLPTYDFGTVPERASDRTEQNIPSDAGPDSEEQQQAAMAVADHDSFNWGYDPVLYNVPEGSYATDPDGGARILEHRRMIAALHAKGLRVVLDVVYNHTLASGATGTQSVLDKCVPAYYHRRSENGTYEASTCMNNTASERFMMERLILESIMHWVVEYRVDGFRFDLMGHITLKCMRRIRDSLDSLTLEEHGIDGTKILLYGEGWEFGEVAHEQRGLVAVQQQLGGTSIGAFNDRIRDSALGGSPFVDPRIQGFCTGLALRSWPSVADVEQGDAQHQLRELRSAQDRLRICLVASLKGYCLPVTHDGQEQVRGDQLQQGGLAYTAEPEESVNYVSAHDNETLFDNTAWKMPPSLFSPQERMRGSWMATSLVALAHGLPFFHAGDELLRSKSLDRDSYNSGDWFNLLDFTGRRSAFGTGLPTKAKNGDKWDLMRPLLRDASVRPTPEMVAATTAKFCELVQLRNSTRLIGLTDASDVLEKVDFPHCGPQQMPGVIVMQICNGPPARGGSSNSLLCDHFARVVIVFSSCLEAVRVPIPAVKASLRGGKLPMKLHPIQANSADAPTREASVLNDSSELHIPPQTASVFVEPLQD
eukprot:TRINITY_DN42611_c0_g1_i1.p1 TRINITY_DN42611_c0_g1~~TRINITY_DN42611_c0_g1_i1.p1  ORF type:complete len:1074 (-),score=162.21 TRINITY_DN42611_c0_g1_i1:240-3422(-)